MTLENEKERDVNEVFEDIFLLEENTIQESYEEGFKLGESQGNFEGYHLGYHRGAELGAEIGYYTGVTESYLKYYENLDNKPEKIINTLENLKVLLDSFPKENNEDVDILQLADNIRFKFKKLCAQLKTDLMFPETSKLSF